MVSALPARAELEARAGSNPSWNTGVNYRKQLELSTDSREVMALYKQAGLDLNKDLDTLAAAPRITADPQAVQYLSSYYWLLVLKGGTFPSPQSTGRLTGPKGQAPLRRLAQVSNVSGIKTT